MIEKKVEKRLAEGGKIENVGWRAPEVGKR